MSVTRIVRTRRWVVILAWERAVVLRDGKVNRTVAPGRERRRRREEFWVLDVRDRRLVVPPQDVLTSDGLQVRISVFGKYAVADPEKWVQNAVSVDGELHALIQLRLREAIAGLTLDELLASRQGLLDAALAPTAEAAADMGVTLESLEIRDITLPQELRRAYAETALARETGKARLEAARGEAAALRSLANTADLLEKHPALIQLRALGAAEASGGQLVLKVGGPVAPTKSE